jgi:uncharacterized phage infection (PIP) family protein YhgE
MMEDETRQSLIGLFRELKTDINGVKMDISAVAAGQNELSAEMNAVYAGQEELKTEINAVSAGQEELKNDIENSISAMKGEISAVKN